MVRQSVLVVEDEEDIRELVSYNLLKEGYQVAGVASGEDALSAVESKTPDLILLDIMLPGLDGLRVCRKLKQDPRFQAIPIIMLTAKGEESDVVAGLNMGADDYVTKPFSPKVLLARVQAVLRRIEAERDNAGEDEEEESEVVEIRDVKIHPGRHEVFVAGKAVDLTATEFKLLSLPGRTPRLGLYAATDTRRRPRRQLCYNGSSGGRADRRPAEETRRRRNVHRNGAGRRVPIQGIVDAQETVVAAALSLVSLGADRRARSGRLAQLRRRAATLRRPPQDRPGGPRPIGRRADRQSAVETPAGQEVDALCKELGRSEPHADYRHSSVGQGDRRLRRGSRRHGEPQESPGNQGSLRPAKSVGRRIAAAPP